MDEIDEKAVKVEFKILKSGFVVVFHRPDFEEVYINSENNAENNTPNGGLGGALNGGLNEADKKIIEYLRKKPESTITELTSQLGIKRRTVERAMKDLRDKDIIERKGSKKSGYWEVK